MPTALVLRTAGTNCDAEMCRAFSLAGASVDLVHLDRLIEEPGRLESADLIGFPGGFSYGDDIASGRIFAMKARERLSEPLHAAVERGVHIIGVCNGFQILVQIGLLPGATIRRGQSVSLTDNSGGRFIDRWVPVEYPPNARCVWTRPLVERAGDLDATACSLPVAHAEGRFVASSTDVLTRLDEEGLVALRYAEDVNGSQGAIAGICDATGRVFGLMPHPDRFLEWNRHPQWTRHRDWEGEAPGLLMFKAAVENAVGTVV